MSADTANWVVVIDDDVTNLKIAGSILSKNGMRVTALNSGQALIDFIMEDNRPDMILLDILMPDLDGFQTLAKLREYEKSKGMQEIPVIFLTAGEDRSMEAKGLKMGALDYVKKPFEPDVLVHRIKNVLTHTSQIKTLSVEASTDKLTGLLNKMSVNGYVKKMMNECDGALLVIDMDNFKLVNDRLGHAHGDQVIIRAAEFLRKNYDSGTLIGRIGGDEFALYSECPVSVENASESARTEAAERAREIVLGTIRERTDRLMTAFNKEFRQEREKCEVSVSAGIYITPVELSVSEELTEEFDTIYKKADYALYVSKREGKARYTIYEEETGKEGAHD